MRHRFAQALRACAIPLLAMSTLLLTTSAGAAGIDAITTTPVAGGGQKWSLSVETLVMLSFMTLLPTILLMMTGFLRIVIVLGLLRQALGLTTTPPNQVIIGISLFLTLFVMSPVLNKVNQDAWQPLQENKISFNQFLDRASVPMKEFMLKQTRETDIALLAKIAKADDFQTPQDVPFMILLPSFVISELKTAFQIGFTIFIPFLIIDLVIASVLMALGMMMVPPATVSLPFKIMLFVLADGWGLLISSLAESFFT